MYLEIFLSTYNFKPESKCKSLFLVAFFRYANSKSRRSGSGKLPNMSPLAQFYPHDEFQCQICSYERRTSPRKQHLSSPPQSSPILETAAKSLLFDDSDSLGPDVGPLCSTPSSSTCNLPEINDESTLSNESSSVRKSRVRERGPGQKKIPLSDVKDKTDCRKKRLAPFFESLNSLCEKQHENKVDVLFFMLISELRYSNPLKSKEVQNLWTKTGNKETCLSAEESLGLRVDSLLTKGQYKKVYAILDNKVTTNVLKPPSQLNDKEKEFLPGSVEFQVISDENVLHHHHSEVEPKPINIMSTFSEMSHETPVPNIKGVRWNYAQALAQSLKEIDPIIEQNIKGLQMNTPHIIKTVVKDGGDGLGEVSVYKEKADRMLPDKAFRFSFCIVSSMHEGQNVYEEKNPNSVRSNRPLLESIADENNKASLVACLRPIEIERQYLKDKIIKVKTGEDQWRMHSIQFYNSMLDEKHDRAISGLQGSGSRYMCNMCHATIATCKEKLGTFTICRTLEETRSLARYAVVNPDTLSEKSLSSKVKGVKALPFSTSDPSEKLIDATHSDINLARFFKKIIIRESAEVYEWEERQENSPYLKNAEKKLDDHLRVQIGINPQLLMPGNYARQMFLSQNQGAFLHFIDDESRKGKLGEILAIFQTLREVYRATRPTKEQVSTYKEKAVKMGSLLKKNFAYANWPNYLHKIIEHVQELLEDPNGPGSIGAFSGEGNEAGNKIFRLFKKNFSTRSNSYKALEDIIRLHWMYSSKTLQEHTYIESAVYICSVCNEKGHNKRTCQSKSRIDQ